MLTAKNFYKRDSHIRFFEKGHIYDIDGDTSFTSVTTIISKFYKKFDANEVLKYMQKKIKDPSNKYFGKSNEQIKSEWIENGYIAAQLGTKMHNNIECFYNEQEMKNKHEMIELYNHFLNFHYKHILAIGHKPYRTEWFIYDEILKIAGSIDMIFQDKNDDNLFHIYDWKRTKKLELTSPYQNMYPPLLHLPDTNFWHYALQLNMYRYILTNRYNISIKTMFLVVLHENNSDYEVKEVPLLLNEICEIIKFRSIQLTK